MARTKQIHAPRKRKADLRELSTTSNKRTKSNVNNTPKKPNKTRPFQASKSVLELAREYHIASARMPIHALSPTWSLGHNRPIHHTQVDRLRKIFHTGTLNRTAIENRILILCPKAEVDRMEQYTSSQAVSSEGSQEQHIQDFRAWDEINTGRKVEILAGQHRVEALKAYVEETGGGDDELWWACDIYDKGIFSKHLFSS